MAYKEHKIRLLPSKEPLSTIRLTSIFDASEEALLDISHPFPASYHSVDSNFTRKVSLFDEIFTFSSTPEPHTTKAYRKIGAGACGAVFAQDINSEGLPFKFAKVSNNTELWNDYVRHSIISKQFRRFQFDEVAVPECHFFVTKETTSYLDHNPDLAKTAAHICHMPTGLLVTERIYPLPRRIRDVLIEKYCSPSVKESAFNDPANVDCLVRVYLGSISRKPSSGMKFFSLRNFKMHLDQMIELDLDIEGMAKKIGVALAIMHWAAKTDARDVEFVLGSSRKTISPFTVDADDLINMKPRYTGLGSYDNDACVCRTTQMWVLDFNQARPVEFNDEGVGKMVDAFRLNDPYYPRPLRNTKHERQVWKAFVVSYLQASRFVLEADEKLGGHVFELPRRFIFGVIDLERKKMEEMRRDIYA